MRKFLIFLAFLFIASLLYADPPGPYAWMEIPTHTSWAGCSLQQINIIVADSHDAIDLNSIQLQVKTITYNWPDPHLTWTDDSILVFTPGTAYANGETVDVILHQANDVESWPLQGAPVNWEFYMDLDIPYFLPATCYPPPGTTICADIGSIAVSVIDPTSGIPYDGLCMCFNTSASGFFCPPSRSSGMCWQPSIDTNIAYRDDIFFVRWDPIAFWFANEDSIEVCLRKAVDRVGEGASDPNDVCGPHWFDTLDVQQCWTFLKDCVGPRVYLIYPNNGDTTACDSIVVGFEDISGIDTMVVQITVTGGGMPYIHSSDYFNGSPSGDMAYYIDDLAEGNITARIMRVKDLAGNIATSGFPTWGFYIDKSPPDASSPQPPDGGVAASSTPNISIAISDARTDVDPTSIVFEVDGSSYPYAHPAVSWDGSRANFSSSIAGLSFTDGDTVHVCLLDVCDIVRSDRCGPNCLAAPYCWSFIVDQSGPQAELIIPPNGGYSACNDQEIVFHLWDLSGVDSTTIAMTVEGTAYTSMDHMTYRNDTLTFTPTTLWIDGQEVNWALTDADDYLAHSLATPLSGNFFIDLTPPNIVSIVPSQWTHFGTAGLIVDWTLLDTGAGVDPATATVDIQGHIYNYPAGFTWDGTHLTFDIASTGLSFTDGDSVAVCLEVGDDIQPQFCGPNLADSCILYIADLAGPIADMVYPPDSAITACADGPIKIYAQDITGINQTSPQLRVDGNPYNWPSPRLSWSGDTLVFTPVSSFSHGDTVIVELLALQDTLGNGLAAPYTWFYIVDIEPPQLTGYSPLHDGEISSTSPTIRFWLEDIPAGTDTTSITIRIQGIEYNIGDLGCTWSSGQVIFNCGIAGVSFSDGDTVDVCFVSASDMVPSSLCGPNTANPDSCWYFRIDLSGPTSDLILPLDGAYTSCANQDIWVYIYDDQGIFPESTAIRVGNDTLEAWLGEITVSNDTAFYNPLTPFSDGEIVSVQLVHATDSLGNTTTGGDIWNFTVDLSPPVWYMTNPPQGSFVSVSSPTISLYFTDSTAGVDPTSFNITIEGAPYIGMLPGIIWINPAFEVNLGMLGFSFGDGDTIDFCFDSLSDLASYCGANILSPDSCWEYYVDLVGPSAQMVYPDDDAYFACIPGTIIVALSDNFGIVDSTVRLSVRAVTYDESDPEMWIIDDTIYFSPSVSFSDGDTISVQVTAAQDLAGNPLSSGGPWQFIMDISGPYITSVDPLAGTILSDASPSIVATVEDIGIGVDPSSARVWLAETLVLAGVSYSSPTGEITFDAGVAGVSFSSGDTITICFVADDSVAAQYCGPNAGDSSCFAYTFDLAGPIASVVEPIPGSFSSCDDQNILIRLFDDYGIAYGSVHLRVDGGEFVLSDTNLSYIGDSMLVFYPSLPLVEGDITVVLWGVTDDAGNPLSGDSLVFTFTTDYTPPYITAYSPPHGIPVIDPSPTITIDYADDGSGIYDSSIVISVNGAGFTIADPCLTWDGTTATLEPDLCGMSFVDGDTVSVCGRASDQPDYCPPNAMTDSCWQFYISSSGPAVTIVQPTNLQITSCDNQEIFVHITDGNGVDESTIAMIVDGSTYTTADAELSYYNDTLHFVPSSMWLDGDTIEVTLSSADDILGTPSPDVPLIWYFIIDLSPPYVAGINPPYGTGFSTSDANVAIALLDDISGVNPYSIQVRVGTMLYSYPAGDITYTDDTLRFSLSGLSYTPMDGESLTICVQDANDQPDICPPNTMTPYCFKYYFDYRGPQVNLFFPPASYFTSCWDTSIIWTVWDPSGIDSASIQVSIDGASCDLTSPLLSLSEPHLIFNPDTDFVEGILFPVEVTHIEDELGNVEGPLEWWVGFDTTSPVISDPDPADGALCITLTPIISVAVDDIAAGVLPNYTLFIINEVDTFAYYDMELTWDGSRFSLDLGALGAPLVGGDTVDVCVEDVMDQAGGCGPNRAEQFCWSFYVDEGGPVAVLLSPPDGAITSCAQESLLIRMRDNNGVDWGFTRIMVDEVEYWITPPEVVAIDDSTLRFIPADPFDDGDTIVFFITQSADTLGHIVTTYPHWSIVIDVSPPYTDWLSMNDWDFISAADSWQCTILDEIAGVDTATIEVTVNGTPASHTISGDTVSVELSAFPLDDGDTVSVCISAIDLVTWCPPNEMGSICYNYRIDGSAPSVSLLYPLPGWISACDNQTAAWLISDDFPLDETSIFVAYEGDTFGTSDTRLTYEGDTLIFAPGILSDGDTVSITFISASDSAGNATSSPVSTWYIIDLSPPYLAGSIPADGAVLADPVPDIWFDIQDDISGVNPASIVITIDGDTTGFEWDGDAAWIICDTMGITFEDGDTVLVCITAYDSPNLCSPNILDDTCITFSINLAGPAASIIEPLPGRFVACDAGAQHVSMRISDIDGIEPATILFIVEADTFTVDSFELSFMNDTMTFIPPTPWIDGDTLHCVLLEVEDTSGNGLASPVSWSFIIDLAEPVFSSPDPPDGGIVSDLLSGISIDILDFGSGVDESSIMFWIDGEIDTYTITTGLIWDGVRATVPESLLPSIGGLISVCASAYDQPDYCEPNADTLCWSFTLAGEGPMATAISPEPGQAISCGPGEQELLILLHDDDGVDEGTILFGVDGIPESFEYENDTLSHIPPTDWEHGDTVMVRLFAEDVLTNAMADTFEYWFVIDTAAPVASEPNPPHGAAIADFSPIITIILTDSIAGIDPDSIVLVIEGDTLTLGSIGLDYEGDTLTLDCGSAGYIFDFGDTITVCVLAADLARGCGANIMEPFCWYFYIPSCIEAEIIYPIPDGAITACDDQDIAIIVPATSALDSIAFIVNSDTFGIADVSVSSDTLFYTPSIAYSSGDTVLFDLIYATDLMGIPICSALESWFLVDTEPPVAESPNPAPGSDVTEPSPIISIILTDSIAGVDTASIIIVINGDTLGIDSAGVSYEGDTLAIDCAAAAISFDSGEDVDICITASDNPDYCPPNEMTPFCWDFTVTFEGPVATTIFPPMGAYVACEDTLLLIEITDPDMVDDTTIQLIVDEIAYTIDSTALLYSSDTLSFVLTPGAEGDTATYNLVSARDILGNPLSAEIDGWFIWDMSAPIIISWGPTSTTDTSPLMWFVLDDSASGIDWSTFLISTGTLSLDTLSPAVWISGDTVFLDCPAAGIDFAIGDTIFCLQVYDMPDFCDAHLLDTCVTISILPTGEGPMATLLLPPNGSVISCSGGSIEITFTDADGVLTDSLGIFIGDSLRLIWADLPLGMSISGDTLRYDNPGMFPHGDTVHFQPLGCDIWYNPVVPSEWTFIIDIEPPLWTTLLPSVLPVMDSLALIEFLIEDEPAGIEEDSIHFDVITPRAIFSFTLDSTGIYWDSETLLIVPNSVNDGAPWTPATDSTLMYFHERETVYVVHYSCDNALLCGNNCAIDTFAFCTGDDDTLPPEIIQWQPESVETGQGFELSIFAFDSSGLGPCCFAIVAGETLDANISIVGDTLIATIPSLISPHIGEILWIEIHLCDNDFDFETAEDREETVCTLYIIPYAGEGPIVTFIQPHDGEFTSCENGPVIALVTDDNGVEQSSVLFTANDDDMSMTWSSDTVFLTPPTAWQDGDIILVELESAEDMLGNPADYTSITFTVDTSGPIISLVSPDEGIAGAGEIARFEITDALSGIGNIFAISNDDTVVIDVLEPELSLSQLGSPPETLSVTIAACDMALYCGINCNTREFSFILMPDDCDAYPIPFTPNLDLANDIVYFDFPDMAKDGGTITILSSEGLPVKKIDAQPRSQAQWDGKRDDGSKAPPGIYIYIISRGDDILCKGTIVLAR